MRVKDVFLFLLGEAHTVVMATADERDRPVTCAADVMDCDETGLCFLTARGKNFYSRLKRGGYVSLTGIKGDSTMTRAAASVSGEVREESAETLKRLLDKNLYMYEIYPTEKSRSALAAFKLYKGRCEWFDLSKKPIERFDMAFGGGETSGGYFVTDKCRACGKCAEVCPQNCVDIGEKAVIRQNNCLRCGNCAEVCPYGAVERRDL